MSLVERGRALVQWVVHSRVGRAVARYVTARGGLLAGGITYSALFSISAALAIGYTAFMTVLGNNTELRQTVLDAVNDALPGILDTGGGEGLIDPDDLVLETALSPGSIVAAGVLLWTAVSMTRALRRGIRAMFGIVTPRENYAFARLRDLGGFLVLALAVLLTAVLGIAVGAAGGWVMDLLGVEGTVASWSLRVVGILVVLTVDSAAFVLLFRVLAGVRAPRRDLLVGALAGGIAASLLRLLGTAVIGAPDNALLASFAVLATLIVWVNLLARVALFVAAWTANPPAPPRPDEPEDTHYGERPNYVTLSVPSTVTWDYHATTGSVQASAEERDAALRRDLERLGPQGLAILAARHEAEVARERGRALVAEDREREAAAAAAAAAAGGSGSGGERSGGGIRAALRRRRGRAGRRR